MTLEGWLPRTTGEKLIRIDTVLAGVVPVFSSTRERIADLLPGHSGRPAGTGEPPGGSGGGGATVVERTVLGADLRPEDPDDAPCRLPSSPERAALDQIDRLAVRVVEKAEALMRGAAPMRHLPGPADTGTVRRLVWARWAIRQLEHSGCRLPDRHVDQLWHDVGLLADLCTTWGEPRTISERDAELAVDDTEQWCRSHLRIGARERRSERYTSDGLCRWCGDFAAEQGWLPTLDIVDAHNVGAHGSTIAKMIRDHVKATTPKVRKKRKGRRS